MTNLHGVRLIHEIILKDPQTTALALAKKVKKTLTLATDMVDCDVRKYEAMSSYEFESPVGTKVKTPRQTPRWKLRGDTT